MRDDDLPGLIGNLLRYGTVASVDAASARVTVKVGEIETQPIRWLLGPHGATRAWSLPTVGEQVLLLAPEGDIEGAIALRGVAFQTFPPAGNGKRELIRFEDGAEIAYDPEGHKLEALLPDGATATIVAPGGITLDADVLVKGTLTAEIDVVADGISLKNHRHGQVQPGSGQSGKPA